MTEQEMLVREVLQKIWPEYEAKIYDQLDDLEEAVDRVETAVNEVEERVTSLEFDVDELGQRID